MKMSNCVTTQYCSVHFLAALPATSCLLLFIFHFLHVLFFQFWFLLLPIHTSFFLDFLLLRLGRLFFLFVVLFHFTIATSFLYSTQSFRSSLPSPPRTIWSAGPSFNPLLDRYLPTPFAGKPHGWAMPALPSEAASATVCVKRLVGHTGKYARIRKCGACRWRGGESDMTAMSWISGRRWIVYVRLAGPFHPSIQQSTGRLGDGRSGSLSQSTPLSRATR